MQNRYLPILHDNISLSVLRVSNEPLTSWGEWVVKIVLNVNYFLLLVIRGGACRSKTKPLWIQRVIRLAWLVPLPFELLQGKWVDVRHKSETEVSLG